MNQSQTISTLNTSIQKAKSDFQQITMQNRSMISQMKLDNSQYTDQLVNQKQKNNVIDTQLALSVIKQQEECALLAQKIEIEIKKRQDLQNLVDTMSMDAREMGKLENSNQGAELPLIQKGVKDAEMKLQQILIKHNEQLAEVDEQKEQLNVGRRERVIYSTVFKGIEKDAIYKQREFQNCIKTNELLKVEQKFLEEQLKLIKQIAEKEQNQFQIEYEELFKPKQIAQEENSFVSDQRSSVHVGPYLTEPKDQRSILQERSVSVQDHITEKQQLIEYEAAFNKLYLETGISSIDLILKQYYNQETWINDLFEEINEINVEIDSTEQDNQSLQMKLDKIQKKTKAPIKDIAGLTETPIDKAYNKIEKNKNDINKLRKEFMQLQKVIGVDLITKEDDETTLLPKVEKLENLLNNILAVSNLYEIKSPKADKNAILSVTSGSKLSKRQDEQKPIKQGELENLLTEVERKKILAESRHTREELEKESIEFMISNQNKKLSTKRSKNSVQS